MKKIPFSMLVQFSKYISFEYNGTIHNWIVPASDTNAKVYVLGAHCGNFNSTDGAKAEF
jgi:hypothetical protein